MTISEFLAEVRAREARGLPALDARNLHVVHNSSGIQYLVNADIVEQCEHFWEADHNDYVYGFYTDKKRRRGADYRWFNLSSVRLAEGEIYA